MICVGIDVAKDKHDCCILDSEGTTLADCFTIDIFLFYKMHLLRTQKTRVILKPSKNIGGVPYAPSQRKQEQAQDRKSNR